MDVGGSHEQVMSDHERNMRALLRIPGIIGVALGSRKLRVRSCRCSPTGCTSREKAGR